jgi:hypothetical protein
MPANVVAAVLRMRRNPLPAGLMPDARLGVGTFCIESGFVGFWPNVPIVAVVMPAELHGDCVAVREGYLKTLPVRNPKHGYTLRETGEQNCPPTYTVNGPEN